MAALIAGEREPAGEVKTSGRTFPDAVLVVQWVTRLRVTRLLTCLMLSVLFEISQDFLGVT
jgi:hypothetical protein